MINWIRPFDTATIKMLQKFSKKNKFKLLNAYKIGQKKFQIPIVKLEFGI